MKKQGAKERLIDTASRLFYLNGYNQTGINQILEEASVAKASMYQHFRSKEDIAVTYLQRRHIAWMAQLREFVAHEKTGTAKLLTCFDFLKSWLKEVEFRGCGFQNIITDLPKDQQKIKDEVLIHKNELRQWIHSALENEEGYSKKKAKEIGDQLVVLLEGAIISAQIQQSTWPIIAAKKTAKHILT